MSPCRRLAQLQNCALRRLALNRRLAATLGASNRRLSSFQYQIAYCLIELQNDWANFVRAYFLSCLMSPVNIRGQLISATMPATNVKTGIQIAMARLKPAIRPNALGHFDQRDEPKWYDVNNLLIMSAYCGCSHNADVQAAFSLGTRTFISLPVFRNYFAHRNGGTHAKAIREAASYGIAAKGHPSDCLLAAAYGRPQALLLDFFDDIKTTIELLCA